MAKTLTRADVKPLIKRVADARKGSEFNQFVYLALKVEDAKRLTAALKKLDKMLAEQESKTC